MQNVSTMLGAHSLQQAQPVVTPSTSGEHSPAETFDSVVNAQTPLANDSMTIRLKFNSYIIQFLVIHSKL